MPQSAAACGRDAGRKVIYREDMRIILIVVLASCAAVGLITALVALGHDGSAIHEIEGLIGALIFTVAAGSILISTTIKER